MDGRVEEGAAAGPASEKPKGPPPRPEDIEGFLLIIGAMKSGTTTLFQYLRQHPQIAPSRRKEPKFFVRDRKGPRAKRAERYARLWPGFEPGRHRYAMEASTHYTKAPLIPNVAQRIARHPGRFRFLYIMRNPIDRIESHLAHNLSRRQRLPKFDLANRRLRQAVAVSRYAYQLDLFRDGLGRDPEVLLLDFDELRENPLAATARCVAHLGLDPDFAFTPIEPANVRRPSESGETFRLDAAQRALLADSLRDDVAALRDRYGFDVSRWGVL